MLPTFCFEVCSTWIRAPRWGYSHWKPLESLFWLSPPTYPNLLWASSAILLLFSAATLSFLSASLPFSLPLPLKLRAHWKEKRGQNDIAAVPIDQLSLGRKRRGTMATHTHSSCLLGSWKPDAWWKLRFDVGSNYWQIEDHCSRRGIGVWFWSYLQLQQLGPKSSACSPTHLSGLRFFPLVSSVLLEPRM